MVGLMEKGIYFCWLDQQKKIIFCFLDWIPFEHRETLRAKLGLLSSDFYGIKKSNPFSSVRFSGFSVFFSWVYVPNAAVCIYWTGALGAWGLLPFRLLSPFYFRAKPLLECLSLTFGGGHLAELFYNICEKPKANQVLCFERGLYIKEA